MKHALRSLVRSPGFTAIAILTLALGIGVNTSMFSVLRTVVIRALPYAHPDRLVHLHRSGNSGQDWPHSVANFVDLHAQQTVFEHLAAVQGATFNLALPGEPADRLRGYRVSSEFFSTLGVPPALGRFFTAAEDRPGHDTVAVLSHRFWQTRFAGDASIVGREIRLDGKTVTVIGVMPPSFEDPLLWGQADLWQPIAFSDSQRANRRSNYLRVIAKMKPGLSLAQADAGLKAAWAPLVAAHPENAQTSLRIEPLAYGSRIDGGPISWFMFALAGLVLLIACANLANLQFARTAARARELAVRASLGATRTQLMRAVFVESLALAVVGGALGVLLALWCNDLLGRQVFIPPATVGIDIPLDYRVLAFALAASTLAGVGFGLFPAWLAARTNVSDALKQGGPAFTASHAQLRVRHLLIVAEVTLAVVLLSTASIFLHGLHRATQRDPGWRVDGLLTASLSIQTPKGTDTAEQRSAYRRAFVQQLEEQLAALPGVEQVGVGTMLPTYGL
ncbi:MAG TPA: ABC transporter permease, partial [Opitutus sp.]|nr:ABC transporter permease [Opitutus sp.]